jgi:hypothetical protein
MALFDMASAALRTVAKTLIKGGLSACGYGRQLFEEARAEARAQPPETPPPEKASSAPTVSPRMPPVATIPDGEPAA